MSGVASKALPMSSSKISKRWLIEIFVRVAVGAAFVYAGLMKVYDPTAFADSIFSFRIVPNIFINIIAIVLPPMEVILGLGVIFSSWTRACSFSLLILLAVFAGALLQGIMRGLIIDCGCFGSAIPSRFGAWVSLGRALLLLVAVLWVYIQQARLPRCGL